MAGSYAGEIQGLIFIGGLDMATELYVEPVWTGRNAVTGRFLKGNTPHNKGKKWSEWMDGRKKEDRGFAEGKRLPRQ